MPVPVPRLSNLPAHPVNKKRNREDGQSIPFQSLTRTLPLNPTGPPPSFGTREQWINSLPSWRRTKPRRIWEEDSRSVAQPAEQYFHQGLALAGNATVIKGSRAEACIPPLYTLLQSHPSPLHSAELTLQVIDGDADDEMGSPDSTFVDREITDATRQWYSPSMEEDQSQLVDPSYERGAFTPVFEEQSPDGRELGSSPLGPATPVNDFSGRPVIEVRSAPYNELHYIIDSDEFSQEVGCKGSYQAGAVCDVPKEPVPAPAPEVATPTATSSYRKLAEPLSEWVANWVWKACTDNVGLPSALSRQTHAVNKHYASSPPSYLASSVHSLLLSTLLQPSAVFLALWYIVKLPIHLGTVTLVNDKELLFREALLGGSHDKDSMEANAPFQLIVLGCMLANKWLDDHTFSNKTWHTISNVPIRVLNNLESLALDIFSYDLSISPENWGQWLSYVMSYHMSLTSPSHPQPIGRPSANPHAIVRKVIDEIIQAPAACGSRSEPVFLGLEERRREKIEKDEALAAQADIDLDEDGPLREEYLPRRRMSGADSVRGFSKSDLIHGSYDNDQNWGGRDETLEKSLPPPAKWSPAGDEPILRERNRLSGNYVAVQPPQVAPYQFPTAYHPPDIGYSNHQWPATNSYVTMKSHPINGYIFGDPSVYHHSAAALNQCLVPLPISHSRSQSLSYDQDTSQSHNHMRSYSQSQFGYRCSDLRMTANELAPHQEVDLQWSGHYAHPGAPAFSGIGYQSAWLRT